MHSNTEHIWKPNDLRMSLVKDIKKDFRRVVQTLPSRNYTYPQIRYESDKYKCKTLPLILKKRERA